MRKQKRVEDNTLFSPLVLFRKTKIIAEILETKVDSCKPSF
jgi:hypothetical protein